MVVESTLTRKEVTQHALGRHFQRTTFYVYAFVCAAITAYGFLTPSVPPLVVWAGWLPFMLYCLVGWITITRRSRDKNSPLLLPTRYELNANALVVSTRLARHEIPWQEVRSWRKQNNVYEINLSGGQSLLVAANAIPAAQVSKFEGLLRQRLSAAAPQTS